MKLKYLSYVGLFIITFLISISNVFAFEDSYGIYCEYKNTDNNYYYFKYYGSSKEDRFYLEQNFDGGEYGDVPSLGVSIESGRPGGSVTDETEINWLKQKGMLNSNGDFVCPINPFGTSLGSTVNSECGESGCHIYDIPTGYETYSCNYLGYDSNKKISMKYTLDESGLTWDITYPDGTNKILKNSQVNGNFMPGKDCGDIFYSASKNKILIADYGSNYFEQTMKQYCSLYDDLEKFCNNGNCKTSSAVCGDVISGYGCPDFLLPVVKFLKIVVFNTLQIFVPIILILMGTIDLVKAVASSDDKATKDATSKFIKRALTAILIFFVTTIVNIVMNMLASADMEGFEDWKACWYYDQVEEE